MKNLAYTKKTFPTSEIVLISDDLKELDRVRRLGIGTHLTGDWRKLEQSIFERLSHPMEFRNSFWFYTIARFFALAEFQQNYQDSLIHIEGDVWINHSFPIGKFAELNCDIAFPMESKEKGAASLLWLKSSEVSQDLVRHVKNQILQDSSHTDMTILGKIMNERLMNAVPLPTLSGSITDMPNLTDLAKQNDELVDWFGGVFDAAAYGMYLLGTDPRNSRGKSKLFGKIPGQTFPGNFVKFSFDYENRKLFVVTTEKKMEVFNLHNHAKNARLWGYESCELIAKRVYLSKKSPHPVYDFNFLVFVKLLVQSFWRRLRKGLRLSRK